MQMCAAVPSNLRREIPTSCHRSEMSESPSIPAVSILFSSSPLSLVDPGIWEALGVCV